MTNSDVMRIALEQSARDIGCAPEDFMKAQNAVVPLRLGADARAYYEQPVSCTLVSYGCGVVAGTQDAFRADVEKYLQKFPSFRCFETPAIHWLDARLSPHGQKACYMAEYFLPDVERLRPSVCRYEVRLLEPPSFSGLYLPEWGNALCEKRKELDVLCAGAFDCGKLAGLAGCSADCGTMWQIGVDVLPEYRRQGIASALTSALAAETLRRGKVPFYCAAWSNIASVRNALKCGFVPAWVELTVKPAQIVDAMNA